MKTQILSSIQRSFTIYPYHLVFITLLPLIILYSNNVSEVENPAISRLLIISLGVGAVIFLFVQFAIGDKKRIRIALIVSLFLIIFLSYGHVYDALRESIPSIQGLVRHRYLIPIITIIFGFLAFLIYQKVPAIALPEINKIGNWLCLIVLTFNLTNIAYFQIVTHRTISTIQNSSNAPNTTKNQLPDIYFIVLDSYAREDVLRTYFGFDNSEFLNELRGLGFYVADCAQSNYNFTLSSISTTLNMDYLNQFDIPVPVNHRSSQPYINHFQENLVKQKLHSAGYKIISFESLYPWMEWKDADVYLKQPSKNAFSQSLQPFELLYLQGTGFRYFLDNNPNTDVESNKVTKFDEINFQLNKLKTITKIASPKFLFINLEITHELFVFNADGTLNRDADKADSSKSTNMEQFKSDYVQSVKFANRELLEIIKKILSESNPQPVIFLQGDHGFRSPKYTNMILSAYYFPGAEEYLYPSISPVNNFRLVDRVLFGQTLSLLPDHYYQKVQNDLYNFTEITESMPGCLVK
jgi:hypothetical protein